MSVIFLQLQHITSILIIKKDNTTSTFCSHFKKGGHAYSVTMQHNITGHIKKGEL